MTSGGGKYVFDDDQEVPDTQIVTWEFPETCLVWEHRMWSKHGTEGPASESPSMATTERCSSMTRDGVLKKGRTRKWGGQAEGDGR